MKKILNLNVKNSKHKKLLRFMKYCLIFIFLGIGACFANETYSQRTFFTFEYKNRTVKEIIQEIERSSEYIFFYMDNSVNLNRKVSVKADNETVEKILDQLFAGTRNQYYISDRQIIISSSKIPEPILIAPIVQQQGRTITGVVNDASGPIIGANVIVKGTTNGSVTNVDGQFTISNVQPNSVLQVSFIGYITREVNVTNQTQFIITLIEDSETLEEVVVVGYGTQKKGTLTGSVATVGSDEIVTTKTENTITNLQGKVTGLLIRQQTGEPGTFDNLISIRGYGSPLVVIDGVTRPSYAGTSELAQLNSEDIENVSILKDASASIYGMNAANGVIIVTTKKGQDGKARISYSNLIGTKMPTGIDRTMSALDYRIMKNEMQRNIKSSPSYSEEEIQKFRNGDPGYTDFDYVDVYLKKQVFQQQHNISVRGGTEKVRYFNSFGYTEDNGLMQGDNQYYNRFNLRSNTNIELTQGLNLNVSFSGRYDTRSGPRDMFEWIFRTLTINDRGYGVYVVNDPSKLSAVPSENKNMAALMDPNIDGYRRFINLQYMTVAELTYKIPTIKGLTLSAMVSYDGLESNDSKLHKKYDLYNYHTGAYVQTNGAGTYWNQLRLNSKGYARGQINYVRSFKQHSLNLMGVAEMTATRYDALETLGAYTDSYYLKDIINMTSASSRTSEGKRELQRFAAYLGRINYDFAGKYLLEVVGRYDGSYRYSPSKRWVFFPSTSIGWRLSEESFIKDNFPVINNLKLKASYGQSGTDAGTAFQYIPGYTSNTSRSYIFTEGKMTTGMVPPGIVNERLSWVTSTTTNYAVEFDLMHGLIGGTVEYYSRKNTGELATRIQSVPNTFGASFSQENINSSLNLGLELNLTHRNKIGKDFSYSVNANVTFARTKTLHDERAPFYSQWDRWKNGNENRFRGRAWGYNYTGRYSSLTELQEAALAGGTLGNSMMLPGGYIFVDTNGDGVINSNDQLPTYWTNQSNPPLQFGTTLMAKYKSFDFSAVLQGASGFTIAYGAGDIWGYGNYPALGVKYFDRWHTVNATDDPYDPNSQWISGFYPALRSNRNNTTDANATDVWQPNATYFRLKSVEVGYDLPKNIAKKMTLSGVRIYVNGSNLLTFCNKLLKYADPERYEGRIGYSANNGYPIMKAMNIGINVNF